jgi:ribosomal protein S18 acetylase RimI-like enzyme
MNYLIRKAELQDAQSLSKLYQRVAESSGGIIRNYSEITLDYINYFLQKSLETGIILVIPHPEYPAEIIAEIHTYQEKLLAFRHILTDLTIVVHPDFQSQKLGKAIFEALLTKIKNEFSHILRVELYVREKNQKAIEFYQKMGFVEEGRLKNKIKNLDNSLETPIEMTWFNPNYQNKNNTGEK